MVLEGGDGGSVLGRGGDLGVANELLLSHDHSYGRVETQMETDEVEKVFCDPPCQFSCNRQDNLVRHKMSIKCYHQRPYVCDACGMRFKTQKQRDITHIQAGRCVK